MESSRSFQTLPVKIIFPAVLTVVLFVATLFWLILPWMEANMMNLKRQTIQELTRTAHSALQAYQQKVQDGGLSRQAAQKQAIAHLRQLRYGPEGKDYFWINDMAPTLIMHPYRPDLEGRDISGFTDPNGKQLFVEFVRTVRAHGAGYVDYEWQWKDDPERIVPKISYVMGFAPWDWILGTGIYIEDVRAEISAVTRRISMICLGILLAVAALSWYMVWQGARAERQRQRAEQQAELHREQLFQAAKMASLGTLVSGVAHEINNPVMSIMLNAPLLSRTWEAALPVLDEHREAHGEIYVNQIPYGMLRERIPRLLDNIEEGAKRIRNIVADLKDFARQSPPDLADSVDLNRVVEKSVGLVENMLKKSTDDFDVRYSPQLPTFAGNTQRIEQVVINLLVNACQSLPERNRAIRIRTGQADGAVFVEIQDQGVGMPAELIRQIRDPFFTTKRESGGTGLGLAISDRIIEEHGGAMYFHSAPGQGTTVRIRFFPGAPDRFEKAGDAPAG